MAKKKVADFSKYLVPGDVHIGLDMSLTSPGICILEGDQIKFYFFPSRKKHIDYEESVGKCSCKALGYYEDPDSREERYHRIVTDIIQLFNQYEGKKISVGVEGYAFGAKGRAMSGLYELGSALRMKLFEMKLKYKEIPPTTSKKYGSGNGRANKQEMCVQFAKQTGIDLYSLFDLTESAKGEPPSPINDVVDAYFLAKMLRGDSITHAPIINSIMSILKEKSNGR